MATLSVAIPTFREDRPVSPATAVSEKTLVSRLSSSVSTFTQDLEHGSTPLADHEQQQFTFYQTLAIVTGLMVNQFLATSDATIVSTSLPTIVADLKGSQNEYAWVGVAYLLTQTMCQPLYGKLSDLLGRKPLLFLSTFVFLVGSALCGAAQSMRWLIIARGVAGVGGGGIVTSVWVMVTEIVPPGTQAQWSMALSVTWSASALAGPILGGLFSGETIQGLSWRWGFWINLPIGVTAMGFVAWCLRTVPVVRKRSDGQVDTRPWREAYSDAIRSFDYLGLILLMGSTCCLVIGFSFAGSNGWTSTRTMACLISGIVGLLVAFSYEIYRGVNVLLPLGMFRQSSVALVLFIAILHNFAFTAGTYYIPLFYQAVHGSSPLVAGMRMLPFSLGSALASVPTAKFIGKSKGHAWIDRSLRIAICVGLVLSILGYGLMITLNEHSHVAWQEVYPLIAGIGIGMLFHTPFQVVTNALPKGDLASATCAFFMLRFIGTTTGLSVAGAVFDSGWSRGMPLEFAQTVENPRTVDLRYLVNISSSALREAVLATVSSTIARIWIVCTPCLGLALIFWMFLKPTHHESHGPSPCTSPISSTEFHDSKSILSSSLVDEKMQNLAPLKRLELARTRS